MGVALSQVIAYRTRTTIWSSGLLGLALLSSLAVFRASSTWLQENAQATIDHASSALASSLTVSLPENTNQTLTPIPPSVNNNSSVGTINPTKTTVTVNGESIPLPNNGSVHMTIPSDSGSQTSVDINVENQNTSSRTHSSLRVQTKSTTKSSTSASTRTTGGGNTGH